MTLLGNRRRGATAGHGLPSETGDELWKSLVRRVEQGDGDAEAQLVRRFEPRIRVMASSRLRGADAALDITQDTIVAVLEALRRGSLREPEKLPAFVFGIARNLINNHFRRSARSAEVGGHPAAGTATVEPATAEDDADRRSVVRECLTELNLLDRRILLLTLVEGMNPREIAPIVRLTPEVVRTRKSRAVQAVRERIAKRDTNAAAKPQK